MVSLFHHFFHHLVGSHVLFLVHCIHCALHSVSDTDIFFFFQAEDGIRDLVRSRGLGDVYKRQAQYLDRRPLLRFLAICPRIGLDPLERPRFPLVLRLSLIHI